jgi:hypothetical protein
VEYEVFVDDDGEVWTATPHAVRRRLHTDRFGLELTSYLIRQAGFVACRSSRLGCYVTLDQNHVALSAIVGTMRWLSEVHPRRTRITIFDRGSQSDALLVVPKALGCLQSVFDARRSDPIYSARKIKLENTPFADKWRVANELVCADIDPHTKARILDELFRGHFTLSHRDEVTGEFVIDHAGRALSAYESSIGPTLIGKSFSDVLDSSYGRWIAERYAQIEMGDGPISEYVEAVIGASTYSPTRLRYQRLLLPYMQGSRHHLLAAAAVG